MPINRDSVAKLANVSSATVSRVYNTPEKVSEELRDQVLTAAKVLGYQPNSAAAILRRNKTGTIAFVEFSKKGRPYYWGDLNSFDWFFGRAIRGVQQVIGQTSWQLRFYTVTSEHELKTIGAQCDGILAYDVDTQEEAAMFAKLNVPSVLSHHLFHSKDVSCICTDNRYGGVLQAKYLYSKGCKKPLYITGYLDTVIPHAQRLERFQSIYPNTQVIVTEIDDPNAYEVLSQKIEKKVRSGSIDSIAAVNDLTLFSLVVRLFETQSLPLVGYDASPLFMQFPHQVASIDIKSGQLYRKAAAQLLHLLSSGRMKCDTVLPTLCLFGQGRTVELAL